MKINKSGAALSRIVQIGETLKELSRKNGKEYLPLNRGVNQVVNIDSVSYTHLDMSTRPIGQFTTLTPVT